MNAICDVPDSGADGGIVQGTRIPDVDVDVVRRPEHVTEYFFLLNISKLCLLLMHV